MLVARFRALYTTIALLLRVKMDSTFCIWLDISTRLLFSANTRGRLTRDPPLAWTRLSSVQDLGRLECCRKRCGDARL